MRIGFGLDIHKLQKGLPLVIGTVKIPHISGCLAHSDGDVLIHSICDALLGAANLGDIGKHFPDSDMSYKGISSSILLNKVKQLLDNEGYTIVNIDTTIVLQCPKISPFVKDIKAGLANILNIDESQISVKSTTSENLGFEGREEGVSAYAVCIIEKK